MEMNTERKRILFADDDPEIREDSMRRAIRSRQEEEELAHLANRGIVTAMSHDLRTPLTALMGYLDILSIEEDPGKKQK